MKHITSSQGIDHLVDTYQQHLRHVKGLAFQLHDWDGRRGAIRLDARVA